MPLPWGQFWVTNPYLLPDLGWVGHDNDRRMITSYSFGRKFLTGFFNYCAQNMSTISSTLNMYKEM